MKLKTHEISLLLAVSCVSWGSSEKHSHHMITSRDGSRINFRVSALAEDSQRHEKEALNKNVVLSDLDKAIRGLARTNRHKKNPLRKNANDDPSAVPGNGNRFDTESTLPVTATTNPPTLPPTGLPTADPTNAPTSAPTNLPTRSPTDTPTTPPTNELTTIPTNQPTYLPTDTPTAPPTYKPTSTPLKFPTRPPTDTPTVDPTNKPTTKPTRLPTHSPTDKPTAAPTNGPTPAPTNVPTPMPTDQPTVGPTNGPTPAPTNVPTLMPSEQPTVGPTNGPTLVPTNVPTPVPSEQPTVGPTNWPISSAPTNVPTSIPTEQPTVGPTNWPTSSAPTNLPTFMPFDQPTAGPTDGPTSSPTNFPTTMLTNLPTVGPAVIATSVRTFSPSMETTSSHSTSPISVPTTVPTSMPMADQLLLPTTAPTLSPYSLPTVVPSLSRTGAPTSGPIGSLTSVPKSFPSNLPTTIFTATPSSFPSEMPTEGPTAAISSSLTSEPIFSNSPSSALTIEPTYNRSYFPSAASPTTEPSSEPTFFPREQCSLSSDGSFGSISSLSERIEVNYDYEIEVDPSFGNASTVQNYMIPLLESSIDEKLLPLLFPELCSRRNLQEDAWTEAVGAFKNRLLTVEIVALDPRPLDVVKISDACENEVRPSSECVVVRGKLSVYLTNPTDVEVSQTIAGVLDSIRVGMEEDSFINAHPSILKLFYVDRIGGDAVNVSPEEIRAEDLRAEGSGASSWLVVAGVVSLTIIGIIVGWRTLKKREGEDDDDEEEESQLESSVEDQPGAVASICSSISGRLDSQFSEESECSYGGADEEEGYAEDDELEQLEMGSQPQPLSAITEEPTLENMSTEVTDRVDGASTIHTVQTLNLLSEKGSVSCDTPISNGQRSLSSNPSYPGYDDLHKYDQRIISRDSFVSVSPSHDSLSSQSIAKSLGGLGGDLATRKRTLGITSRNVFIPEDIMKSNTVLFSPPHSLNENIVGTFGEDGSVSHLSGLSLKERFLSDEEGTKIIEEGAAIEEETTDDLR